jgi:hypothetical protein
MPLPPVATQHGDEFCSTECARQHYGGGRGERTTPRKLYIVGRKGIEPRREG